jgi:hypothetical protein
MVVSVMVSVPALAMPPEAGPFPPVMVSSSIVTTATPATLKIRPLPSASMVDP